MNKMDPFFHSFNQCTRQFSKGLNDVLTPMGLYAAQWPIIYRLKTTGPSTQVELSTYLSVEAPTMTRALLRLEKSGWISRVPGKDKREKKILLTDAALTQYPDWLAAVEGYEQKMLEDISEEELMAAISVMQKMKQNSGR
ncbi:MarR family transcriptional regulator [Bacillus infantis]|uniref:MarR family winged helix-turn-helix transcriptional regulator n=1 Tax=Bacillus infantis TaxID=324767 RepID=UPI001CD23D2E|nr:MarR family transcriptional regulator [Bacillus infantis]MCA1040603.1 MarR family transcriptional regulator [Bacillus infantis]